MNQMRTTALCHFCQTNDGFTLIWSLKNYAMKDVKGRFILAVQQYPKTEARYIQLSVLKKKKRKALTKVVL